MTFEPVFLEQWPTGMSQTFLRHTNLCPRSGFLYQRNREQSAQTMEMARGTAMHEILSRATSAVIENDEPLIPPELVKAIADEVLGELPVPIEEHDYVRECCYRWASEMTFDPAQIIANETLFELDVDSTPVRCRVDFAQLSQDNLAVQVLDYKSGRGIPTQEDISRKLPDGTLLAKNFQLVLYALAVAFGVPVRMEGEQEVREPFPVAERAQRFDLWFVYPGVEDREGRSVWRGASLSRLELAQYRGSLEALVRRSRAARVSGDWPAIVSGEACSICPEPAACPIPAQVRDHRGTIQTVQQAAEAAMVLDREKSEHRARQAELREFAKAHDGLIRYGARVMELVYSEHDVVTDKDGLLDAVDAAVEFGEPFDRGRFVQRRGRTDLKTRDLTAEEMQR